MFKVLFRGVFTLKCIMQHERNVISGRIKDCVTLEQRQSPVGISNYIAKYRAIVFKIISQWR